MAVGAYAGTLGGYLYDMDSAGVGVDFLAEAGTRLQPGKTAVVAEIEEEWVTPVDTRMEALGGVVSRGLLKDVRDELIKRDAEALKAEIAQLKAEHAQATEKAKIKLEAKIDADWARLQAMQDRAKTALETSRREMDAKIKSLQEQVNKAKGDAKAKFEARIAEVRSDYGRRADLLKKAWELTKQALAA